MNTVVNLNKARKAKLKQDATAKARQNRVIHGMSAAQRKAALAENERAQVQLDKNRREGDFSIKYVDDKQ
ncbi:MAG: DUF4169 family protein [Asticcacaulis sp.]